MLELHHEQCLNICDPPTGYPASRNKADQLMGVVSDKTQKQLLRKTMLTTPLMNFQRV